MSAEKCGHNENTYNKPVNRNLKVNAGHVYVSSSFQCSQDSYQGLEVNIQA